VRIEYQEEQTIAIRSAPGASIAGTAPNYNLAVVRLRKQRALSLEMKSSPPQASELVCGYYVRQPTRTDL